MPAGAGSVPGVVYLECAEFVPGDDLVEALLGGADLDDALRQGEAEGEVVGDVALEGRAGAGEDLYDEAHGVGLGHGAPLLFGGVASASAVGAGALLLGGLAGAVEVAAALGEVLGVEDAPDAGDVEVDVVVLVVAGVDEAQEAHDFGELEAAGEGGEEGGELHDLEGHGVGGVAGDHGVDGGELGEDPGGGALGGEEVVELGHAGAGPGEGVGGRGGEAAPVEGPVVGADVAEGGVLLTPGRRYAKLAVLRGGQWLQGHYARGRYGLHGGLAKGLAGGAVGLFLREEAGSVFLVFHVFECFGG